MLLRVRRSYVEGNVTIPGSKSHTIRALFMSSLAGGTSRIINPLISDDALSAVNVCRAFGANINMGNNSSMVVEGFNGRVQTPEDVINIGNSGTSLRFALATAALNEGYTVLTGDSQIRRRPLEPLIKALNNLGAHVVSTRGNNSAPVVIKGRARGGSTELDAVSSQFLSSLIINAPLFENDTEIILTRINEVPYAEMTLWWLDKLGIRYENNSYKSIYIKGKQHYKPFDITVPGDFSSATFFMVLAAVSGREISMRGLDMTDVQGDKAVLSILEDMGASVCIKDGIISVKGNELKGREIDMNAIPDALPAMAVAGCFAEGETRLVNVPQARLKETDRINVMCTELTKMGADIKELDDGLVIRRRNLRGCNVSGHGDHRVVMALAIAGLSSGSETHIDTAEAMNVTFPEFVSLIRDCGGDIQLLEQA